MEATISQSQAAELARSLTYEGHLRFTNLANMRMVKKEATRMRIKTFSRTAHGSKLDPRYTVEGSHLPDRGLGNAYDSYQPKLYVLEVDRW